MGGLRAGRTVGEVMTRDPITIDPAAPLAAAAEVMRDRGLRHLPVVDDAGRLAGMLTDRDVRSAAFAPALAEYLSETARRQLGGLGAALEDLRVRDVMTWDAVTIEPHAPVGRAAAIMLEGRIGSLPVVEGGRLVGIVTESDILRVVAATLTSVRGADPDTYLW